MTRYLRLSAVTERSSSSTVPNRDVNDDTPYASFAVHESSLSSESLLEERWKTEEEGFSQYDDFHTIDWLRDRVRDQLRHRCLIRLWRQGSLWDKSKVYLDSASGWLVVLLVGIAAGFTAAVVDIGCKWMSDLKQGVCRRNLWFNREACCWVSSSASSELECDEWVTWAGLVGLGESSKAHFLVNYIFYISMATFFASLSAFMVKYFAPYACGSGIAEIKTVLSGFIIHGFLGFWTCIIKTLALMPSVASGLNLGQEGPMVHIGCCIANVMVRICPKYWTNEAKKREVLSAGAAAGVAVAFGAPIGGVLFSLEEVSYYFPLKTMWRTFFCALIAAFTLSSMNPYFNGHLVLYYVSYDEPWKMFELVPFILLGILGGLYGALFTRLNLWWSKMRRKTFVGNFPVSEVLVMATLTALVSYPNEFARESLHNLLHHMFKACGPDENTGLCDYIRSENSTYTMNANNQPPHAGLGPGVISSLKSLVVAFVLKSILSIFTFGLKVPAGLFVPSLAVGAIVGRIIGIITEYLTLVFPEFYVFKQACSKTSYRCVTPGLYAIIGAAAHLGGVTRMTVALVVIMFELTGGLVYIVPLMISIMVAKWVGDALSVGIYEGHIHLNGYPFLDNKEEFRHTTLASDMMRPRPGEPPTQVIPVEGKTVEDIEMILASVPYKGFPIVFNEQSNLLYGFILRKDIKMAIEHAQMRNECVISTSPVYFSQYCPHQVGSTVAPLNLHHMVDMTALSVSECTPSEIIVEMFRKLGLRQLLVTTSGKLMGIITKKDVLHHISFLEDVAPPEFVF